MTTGINPQQWKLNYRPKCRTTNFTLIAQTRFAYAVSLKLLSLHRVVLRMYNVRKFNSFIQQ
jgi:hypothetical protein